MRPGQVVQIRVNPRDCMAVSDLLDAVGAYTPGMSFSQAVSIALSTALHTLKMQQKLPDRDGFEYNQMMQRFPVQRNAKKVALTNAMHLASASSTPLALPSDSEAVTISSIPDSVHVAEATEQDRERLAELHDLPGRSREQEVEYRELMRRVYGG